jgi:hypothetical protein
MDAKIIPFPKRSGLSTSQWAQAACWMLQNDISTTARMPERMFICYQEAGKVYYLNLNYDADQLGKDVALAVLDLPIEK